MRPCRAQGDDERGYVRLPFDEDLKKLTASLADIETRFSDTEGKLQETARQRLAPRCRQVDRRNRVLGDGLSGLDAGTRLVKARARVESITMPNIKLASDRA